MKVGEVITALYEACHYVAEETEARNEMAEILRGAGWHVCETDTDLREEALASTDLVEPGENE